MIALILLLCFITVLEWCHEVSGVERPVRDDGDSHIYSSLLYDIIRAPGRTNLQVYDDKEKKQPSKTGVYTSNISFLYLALLELIAQPVLFFISRTSSHRYDRFFPFSPPTVHAFVFIAHRVRHCHSSLVLLKTPLVPNRPNSTRP